MNNEVDNAKKCPEVWIKNNKGLFESIANTFTLNTSKFSKDDLIQEAHAAAIYAIEKFKTGGEASLSTYVYTASWRACRDFVRKNKHDLYITPGQQNKEWKNASVEPTEQSTANNKFASFESPMAVRMDRPNQDRGSGELAIASGELSALDGLIKKEQVEILLEEMNCLSDRERDIINSRYWNKETLEEVAIKQGCSRQRIDIISKRAMTKLTEKVKKRLDFELFI